MKVKSVLIAPVLSLLAFATPAVADDDGGAPVSPQTGQGPIQNPEERNGERSEFNHRINEEHEGSLDILQFFLIGGALIIAALLAYQAGKRTRKKDSN